MGQHILGGTALHNTSDVHLNFPCSGSGPQGIVSAGDFNHDGFNDVVMFHQYCENDYWGVFTLHLGGNWINPEPAFVIEGWTDPFNLIHFKAAVSLGDINGDSIDDLGIGANGGIEYLAQRGKVVILGGDSSLHVATDEPHVPLPQSLQVRVYPNPFNASCTISLALPGYQDHVHLTVYNLLGQEVQTVKLDHVLGQTDYHFDGSNLTSGVYLLRVTSGSLQTTTKLMVLK
jgi:hypothetical protein